jgi:hypothetical protein
MRIGRRADKPGCTSRFPHVPNGASRACASVKRVFNLPLSADISRFDVTFVEAVMLWPGETEAQGQAFERSVVEIVKPGFGALPATVNADLFALADAAYPLPAIQARATKPHLHGMIAGKVLNNLLALITCDPDNASMAKAIEMALPTAKQLSSSTFNCTISSSTFNHTIWPKFRCVAHLWAAYLSRVMFDDRRDFPCSVGDLPAFLADAEGYRVMGESRKTKQSPKNTILPAGETIQFRLPESVAVEPTVLCFDMERGGES